MNRTPDQLREQESKRQRENDWFANHPPTWAPTLTKEEREQRDKDIASGKLPF